MAKKKKKGRKEEKKKCPPNTKGVLLNGYLHLCFGTEGIKDRGSLLLKEPKGEAQFSPVHGTAQVHFQVRASVLSLQRRPPLYKELFGGA